VSLKIVEDLVEFGAGGGFEHLSQFGVAEGPCLDFFVGIV
jgi:hypothetical protein